MTLVTLSWREARLAAFAGVDRRLMDLHARCNDRNGAPSVDNGWQIDIVGALGEWTVAKALDLYWSGANNERWLAVGDVARLQVRATARRDGHLIIHPDDPDNAPFVLVTGQPPEMFIPGWMAGGDAKDQRWWREDVRTPAYFVPQTALHPLAEFVEANP